MSSIRLLSYNIIFLLFLLTPAVVKAESFFVSEDFDLSGRGNIEADMEVSGEKAVFFVERDFKDILSDSEKLRINQLVMNLSSEFDNHIYPKTREIFGNERSPGIDGDEKITVLFHSMKAGVGGYVRDADAYNDAQSSNLREMVYIGIDDSLNGDFSAEFLAHEFQHLITFNQKTFIGGVREEQWLNEARSEYTPTLLGYNNKWNASYLKKRVGEFLSHPSDALLDWRGRSVDHASASLFMHYLVGRYGVEILSSMMSAKSAGIESINGALNALGYEEKFSDVFSDWIVAVYVNSETNNEPDKYGYKNTNLSFGNLHVLPSSTARIYGNYSSSLSFILDNWSGHWYRFVPGSLGEETVLHIKFSNIENKSFSIPYVVSDFFGGVEVKFFDLTKSSVLSVPDFGTFVSSLVVIPNLVMEGGDKISETGKLSIETFVSNSFADRFSEGALIRAVGDNRVFIVKNGSKIGRTYKRWIQTEEVFGFYGHLKWEDIIDIEPSLLLDFEESYLIRRAGDAKVYEVDPPSPQASEGQSRFGRKVWLDMTAEEFEASGRDWDAVYEVNDFEFNWYL